MKPQYPLTPQNVRYLSIFYVLIGLLCVALTYFHIYNAPHTMLGTVALVAVFTIVLPGLTFLGINRPWLAHIAVHTFILAACAAFFYFIGAYTPFALLWIIVIVLSYLYSGAFAFAVSSFLIIIESAAILFTYREQLISSNNLEVYATLSLIVVMMTILLAYVWIRMLLRFQEKTRKLAESQRAEEVQLNRLNTLLNSISDTVLTLNRYGRITSQNSAALSFFDTNESLVGKSIDTFLHLQDEKSEPVSLRKLVESIRGTLIRDDVSIKDSSGAAMRLSVQLSPIHGTFGDEDSGCVVIIRDITRQKTLEDEKDEFISVTSHELRTPIAIAEGSLGNLTYMFEKGMPAEKLKQSAETAHDQVLYLGRMINDLSTLSRAERGVGDAVEDIDLNILIQDLFLRYQPEAKAKSLTLNLDLGKLSHVVTSKLYLEEMLQNFITNAIKYTKEGSVTLAAKEENGIVTFSVTDTGIGISKTDQDKVFDKFFRSEDYRTRETNGTGLGLYVVRKLADKLSTKITVESRLNHGSTFSFTLPVATQMPQEDPVQ